MKTQHHMETENYSENSENQFLMFSIGENNFAVNIRFINEVIEPIDIIHIPHMNESVPGLINLRGSIMPVIDLKHHLFQNKIELNNKSRIIIFSITENDNESLLGVIVDSVNDVLNLSKNEINSVQDFATKIKKDYIESATQVSDSIIIILNIANVLLSPELSDLKDSDIDMNSLDTFDDSEFNIGVSKESKEIENEIEFITFQIDQELYGIKTELIKEIITIEEFRKIPNALPFLKGVVNIRGEIIPVIDMRSRCGLPTKEYDKKTSILIIKLQSKNIGLVVEKLNDVMKFNENQIQDIPHYSANIDRDFIDNMVESDGKIFILININRILSSEEFDNLSKFNIEGS